MSHKGTELAVLALERPAVMARGVQQRVQFNRREVGERVHFEITPNVLDGVEFRCVRRKEMRMQSLMAREELTGNFSTMGLKAVPNQGNGTGELLQEYVEEVDDGGRVYVGVGVKPEIQVNVVPGGRHAKRRDHGHFLMRTRALIEQRRLAAWTPRAANQWGHQHAALVNKRKPGLQARGFFLMRGHWVLTQPWIKSSSRSTARRVGFWGLQPNEWSNRPIWST